MRSREIASFTIENAQGRVSVAVGDTVTIHTLNGGGMGGCTIVSLLTEAFIIPRMKESMLRRLHTTIYSA